MGSSQPHIEPMTKPQFQSHHPIPSTHRCPSARAPRRRPGRGTCIGQTRGPSPRARSCPWRSPAPSPRSPRPTRPGQPRPRPAQARSRASPKAARTPAAPATAPHTTTDCRYCCYHSLAAAPRRAATTRASRGRACPAPRRRGGRNTAQGRRNRAGGGWRRGRQTWFCVGGLNVLSGSGLFVNVVG